MKLIKQNPLVVVFVTIFLDMLGFGVLIPVIPLLLANPASQYYLLPAGISIQTGYILLGLLTAVYPLGQFFATPILGQLSDKYGRKRILRLSLMGTCLSYILFAIGILIGNIPLLFFSRFFDGITGGNISVAQAAIADITKPENRSKNFGLIGMAFGLGFIFGPYLGGKLSDPSVVSWFNAATPFWAAALLSFGNVIMVTFMFPETHPSPNRALVIKWAKSLGNIGKALHLKSMRVLLGTNFLFQAGFTFFTTFFSVFLISRFGFNQGNIGDFFAYTGLWIAFTQGFVTRRTAKKWREATILKVSILGVGIALLVYFAPQAAWQMLLVTPFFAIFTGLTQSNMTALISRSAGPEIQGEVLGINASVQALAQTLPPILSGFIAAQLAPFAPIAVSVCVIVSAGILFVVGYRPLRA